MLLVELRSKRRNEMQSQIARQLAATVPAQHGGLMVRAEQLAVASEALVLET